MAKFPRDANKDVCEPADAILVLISGCRRCFRRSGAFPTEPCHEHGNAFFVEPIFLTEGGHAIVAFTVKTFVRGVLDHSGEPFGGAVTGEIGGGGTVVGFAKLMAFGAAHFVRSDE